MKARIFETKTKTWQVEDLRLQADKLALTDSDQGDLMHALIDCLDARERRLIAEARLQSLQVEHKDTKQLLSQVTTVVEGLDKLMRRTKLNEEAARKLVDKLGRLLL